MENNSYMNKIILINIVYMYKQINGKIPTLKKIEDIISKIGIKIDQIFIKKFLEKLQKIDFKMTEINGRKKIEFIKKQKPIIIYKNSLLQNNISNNIDMQKKEIVSKEKEDLEDIDIYRPYSDTEDVLPDLFDD
ncbi:hypothetical protein M951_chr2145 (nucleomorph) [Lotharella oceanica]|uniref:Uncharacterized protein n=1 Tax=Lotharella oceanica TaxID=641309 RepID=A0A060DBH4_9EUKA|nr:hypothetical protein M951_chr2145 [Lotharella oceanica]